MQIIDTRPQADSLTIEPRKEIVMISPEVLDDKEKWLEFLVWIKDITLNKQILWHKYKEDPDNPPENYRAGIQIAHVQRRVAERLNGDTAIGIRTPEEKPFFIFYEYEKEISYLIDAEGDFGIAVIGLFGAVKKMITKAEDCPYCDDDAKERCL